MSGDTLLNDRYKLVSQLASGGMAVVYKAIDQDLGRTVAIKILRPSLTIDPTFIARFKNEARSIANLSHPNIVIVHDVGSDGPTHYIVMELVDGHDLKRLIRTHGALPVDRALNIAIGICAGIGYAHRAKIVHADIKPQNVLLTKSNEQVKITDFGIAQALSESQPVQKQSVVWGSPHYFAPEQAQGEKPTAASDVYSIGIVMFEMLTGRLPFTGASQQDLALAHIQAEIPRVKDFNPAVPDTLSDIVYKLMSKKPQDRYRMADQLGHVLISFRDQYRQGTVPRMPRVEDQPPAVEPKPTPPPGLPTQPGAAVHKPPQAMPTQRYNVVPEAPAQPNYGQPPKAAIPAPPGTPAQQQAVHHPRAYTRPPRAVADTPPPPPGTGSSVPYTPHMRPIEDDPEPLFDGVTIALAFLAFMAIMCLVPLYIVALQARL
ncbi:MAG: hypothetical protein CUN56_12735 [Phototrophicales bacterium]|nr:MAG: hypothetical protein CUN56_12735 [Phototrophicales bacterium]RMG72532.1 MAG: serine/threonine protein kinase [Chloroflexota bacterium]